MRAPRDPVVSAKRFGIKSFWIHDGKTLDTIGSLPQWQAIGAQCTKCGHVGWLDKRALLARLGNVYLLNLRHKLRCRACERKGEQDVLIGKLDRKV